MSFSMEKASWTMLDPCHKTISRFVFFITYLPRLASGAKIIFLSCGILETMVSALEEVQIISLMALISAEQLMYVITTWSGYALRNFPNSSGVQLSAKEQP